MCVLQGMLIFLLLTLLADCYRFVPGDTEPGGFMEAMIAQQLKAECSVYRSSAIDT